MLAGDSSSVRVIGGSRGEFVGTSVGLSLVLGLQLAYNGVVLLANGLVCAVFVPLLLLLPPLLAGCNRAGPGLVAERRASFALFEDGGASHLLLLLQERRSFGCFRDDTSEANFLHAVLLALAAFGADRFLLIFEFSVGV